MVDVVFRKDRDEIVAVFPGQSWGNNRLTCYAIEGQHSGCSLAWYRTTKPAKPEEYAALLAHLKYPVGYQQLTVKTRIPPSCWTRQRG